VQNDNSKLKIELKKRAYFYGISIIRFIDVLNKHDFASQVIAKQLLRSATSVGANIIEAQAASTKRDFTNYFTHALKSANESKFWLGLLRDTNKTDQLKANELLKETRELANILGSSILTLKGEK
jgi:four helix bundle protein